MSNLLLKLQPWFEARKRFKLSHAHIQMARELGLNPKKFGSLANDKQQPWKAPLPDFIDYIYFKHFKCTKPAQVKTLEQLIEADELKRNLKRERKLERKAAELAQQSEPSEEQQPNVRGIDE
jgi:hypothetical protein